MNTEQPSTDTAPSGLGAASGSADDTVKFVGPLFRVNAGRYHLEAYDIKGEVRHASSYLNVKVMGHQFIGRLSSIATGDACDSFMLTLRDGVTTTSNQMFHNATMPNEKLRDRPKGGSL